MGRLNKKSILAFFALITMLILVACNSSQAQESQPMDTGLDPNEWNNYAFKDIFPTHWESYIKNMENQKEVIQKK